MAAADLTAARLRELLHYDPETGFFTWIAASPHRKCRNGKMAGTVDSKGRIAISISRRLYGAHRLAWLYMTGKWPNDEIDHVNRTPTDNRFQNLRDVTRGENCQNLGLATRNTSGHTGVHWYGPGKKWRAIIQINRKVISLGYFKTLEDAVNARREAKLKFHPTAPRQ